MRELLERASSAGGLSFQELHVILDMIPVPLSWASIPSGEILFVNRAFTRTFGYPDGAFQNIDEWIEQTYPSLRQRQEARRHWMEIWADDGRGTSEISAFDVEILCADGTIRTFQHRGMVIHPLKIGIASFEDISERRRSEDIFRRYANEDPLTGLPNRRVLQDFWERLTVEEVTRNSQITVLLLDLDGFKHINDTHGHDVGDEVLKAIGGLLKQCVGENDLVCRIGGDEFAVLLPGVQRLDFIEQLCWRINAELRRSPLLQLSDAAFGASIGVSLYPNDGIELELLLKKADQALYQCKTGNKGGWVWFQDPKAA